MDKYDLLKQKIESYLEMPDFIDNEYQISASSLYEMLKKRFSLLSDKTIINNIKADIKKKYKTPKKFGLFKTKEETEFHTSVEYSANLKRSILNIWQYRMCNFSVIKDCDSNEIYFENALGCNIDSEIVRRHYDEIMELFSLCEYFTTLLGGSIRQRNSENNPNFKPQIFSDGFLNVTITYSDRGEVSTEITISKDADPDNVCARIWLNRKTLNEILKENKDIIIKKIPIDIDELNCVSRQIYDEEHQIKPKVKVLQNNSFKN